MAPARKSSGINLSDGASRISSVSGLNANPNRAILLPFRVPHLLFHLLDQPFRLIIINFLHVLQNGHFQLGVFCHGV